MRFLDNLFLGLHDVREAIIFSKKSLIYLILFPKNFELKLSLLIIYKF